MKLNKILEGTMLKIEVEGRLDTSTAPSLEIEIKRNITGVTELILDIEKLDYLSSAGLRVLLSAQKVMNTQGTMIIKNANETVLEVFEVTGFSDFLTVE